MTDFITRLVQRQRGEIPTIAPLLPPSFVRATIPDMNETERSPAPIVPAALGASVDAPSLRRPEPTAVRESIVERIRTTAVEHGEAALAPPHQNVLDAESMLPRSLSREPALDQRSVPAPIVPAESLQMTDPLERAPVLDEPGSPPAVLVRSHTEVASPVVFAPAVPTARMSDAAPAPLVRSRSLRDSVQHETPHPNEPPVHVTIGRIEVTAMAPPAAARRPSVNRKRATSLEDYLARRRRSKD